MKTTLLLLPIAAFCVSASAQNPATPAQSIQKPVSYSKEIVPILRTACLGCHGEQNPAGGYSVVSYDALMRRGSNGVEILPGKSGQSRLFRMLTGAQKPIMPPGPGLRASEIELFRRWIDDGAKNDTAVSTIAGKSPSGKIAPREPTAPTRPKPIGALRNAPAPILSLIASTDGKTLFVGAYQSVLFLDATTRAQSFAWEGHADSVRALALSPDGATLAAGSGTPGASGEIRRLDLKTRREIRALLGPTDSVNALAFSSDGAKLAAASADRNVYLYETATGKTLFTLREHGDSVRGVAFHPNGKWLATGSADKTIKLWDVATGKRLYSLSGHDDSITALAFLPNGQLLSASVDRTVRLWNIGPDSGGQIRVVGGHSVAVNALTISRDGQTVATAAADRIVRLWRIADGHMLANLAGGTDWTYAIALIPETKQTIAGTFDGQLLIFQTETGKLEATVIPTTAGAKR